MIGLPFGRPGAQYASGAFPGATAASDSASRYGSPEHARLWARLSALEVEARWPADLGVLVRSPEWLCATTVLDLCADDGAFGRRAAERFPLKSIVGLEPDADVHAVGAQTPSPPNYLYLNGDFDPGLEGFFDVVVARAESMFTPDRRSLARWASEHCGAALITYGSAEALSVRPDRPGFSDVLLPAEWSNPAPGHAARRDREIAGIAGVFTAAGFTLTGSTTEVTEMSGVRGRLLAHHLLRTLGEFNDATATIGDDLLDDLFEWSLRDDACMTLGATWHRLSNTRTPWLAVSTRPVSAARTARDSGR